MIAHVRQVVAAVEVTTPVCTGVFLLERAGLLDGKQATTHWASRNRLRGFGTVEVVAQQRWVDAGPIVTAAGVSAGIDMALYLAARRPARSASLGGGSVCPDPQALRAEGTAPPERCPRSDR